MSKTNERVQRDRRAPDRLGVITGDWWEFANVMVENDEPRTYGEAMKCEKADQWQKAIDNEMNSLRENRTWDLVDLPEGKNVVGSQWVFKEKRGANGEITKYKARLVAQGYSQEKGSDYDETFAPVAKYNSLRTLLAIANELDLEIHQMDVKTAFLNGDLDAEIYMKQPDGFVKDPSKVCKLNKSIYGLKQSARLWNVTIDSYLKSHGYKASIADPCIYTKSVKVNDKTSLIIIAVYVDDFTLASNDLTLLEQEKNLFAEKFDMVDQGEINYILGMRICRDRQAGVLRIDQSAYLRNVLKRFGMYQCRPNSTPMKTDKSFVRLSPDEKSIDLKNYQATIDLLTYASIGTRPELSYSVRVLSQFMPNPDQEHWKGVKRVFRYIQGTLDYCLEYVSSKSNRVDLSAYSDADSAGDKISRKSTSGYLFQIGKSPVTWRSHHQSVIALSTT